MIEFIITVLVICALVAVIWSKEAAQKLFGTIMGCTCLGIAVLFLLGLAFFLFVGISAR